jgi:fructose-bisphosphate aldolase, class I
MNIQQFDRIKSGRGFIAALDQSGGSTPKALAAYGIPDTAYSNDEEMFDLVHQMRTRIIESSSFNSDRVLGAILFESTMDRQIENLRSADYLWQVKGLVPFLKIDKGLEAESNGAQLMKPIPDLDSLLGRAIDAHMFGTKMRSFVTRPSEEGIKAIVAQQFAIARTVLAAGLVPIIETEIDIHSPGKSAAESILKAAIAEELNGLSGQQQVMVKLTLPEQNDFYADFVADPRVLRVLALSGGYGREEADERLTRNHGMIASFSRALTQGTSVTQSNQEFDAMLDQAVASIFRASTT